MKKNTPRLFIDVDDTLIIYENDNKQNPYGVYNGEKWSLNQPLFDAIVKFRETFPDALIVVWSGGGQEYAQMWVNGLMRELDVVALDKSVFNLVRWNDIVVDDYAESLKLPEGCIALLPHEAPATIIAACSIIVI
jgi:hypothetical protein